ncbi:MAG: protein-L-isoaspartate O-methyltransferase [Verrucomicrobia bacterium GWC2_42_7]|nr:MAG: protein-L-isoaspartate O-methyltransferase [Verrucomicrobia bacterium GWC2_42_7]
MGEELIEELVAMGIWDREVLEVMSEVPREEFVPEEQKSWAYENRPLPIGFGATISQPYIVAFMTQALRLKPNHRVLEIGTGSGYQAAILSQLVSKVYSIENEPHLAVEATKRLRRLGYSNVRVKAGDGYEGWAEHSPYDGIIVTAAAPQIPHPLIIQLKKGGRLVIPVGRDEQRLQILQKTSNGLQLEGTLSVSFVPMRSDYL